MELHGQLEECQSYRARLQILHRKVGKLSLGTCHNIHNAVALFTDKHGYARLKLIEKQNCFPQNLKNFNVFIYYFFMPRTILLLRNN